VCKICEVLVSRYCANVCAWLYGVTARGCVSLCVCVSVCISLCVGQWVSVCVSVCECVSVCVGVCECFFNNFIDNQHVPLCV
jgi:hypothetical protein